MDEACTAGHLCQVLREDSQLHSIAELTPALPQVDRACDAARVSACTCMVSDPGLLQVHLQGVPPTCHCLQQSGLACAQQHSA